MSLYENMNRRLKLGISRSKKNSNFSANPYSLMKQKKDGFAADKKIKINHDTKKISKS
jgi:hypothetical protein